MPFSKQCIGKMGTKKSGCPGYRTRINQKAPFKAWSDESVQEHLRVRAPV